MTILGLLEHQPLYPYGIQRRLRQWGKDLVVNTEDKGGLYRTIGRLEEDGLIEASGTEREGLYGERTIYSITDAGRRAVREWLDDALRRPRPEYPRLPTALSSAMMLKPAAIADALEQRLAAQTEAADALRRVMGEGAESGLPRVGHLETEYMVAILDAEVAWLRATVADLREERLTWSAQELEEHAGPDPDEAGPDA